MSAAAGDEPPVGPRGRRREALLHGRDRTTEVGLAAYIAVAAVLVLTPGSTTAVVVRNTLGGGPRAGLAVAGGAALANASHAAAAGLGLAVLVARWPRVLDGMRIAGAVYLAFLGAGSLRRAMVPVAPAAGAVPVLEAGMSSAGAAADGWGSFREGLTVNLLNPAIATFYLVVVPTFVPAAAPRGYFAWLAAFHVSLAFVCHAAWAAALGRVSGWLTRPPARRVLEAATGVALLGLAVSIL